MHTGGNIPQVASGAKLTDALMEMGQKALGMTTVMQGDKLLGVFTDGDLRRAIDQGIDLQSSHIDEVMTVNCKSVPPNMLADEALHIMEEHKITTLVVKDDEQLLGVLHMHELLKRL
jgi:arabinose-5-phosphate isomerase